MSVCSLIDAVIETLETLNTNGDEGGSGGGNQPHFCFVDIISSTQHRSTPEGIEAFRDDLGGLENVITTAARTVVFCTPLLRPAALTRCWCIYEIMKSMIHGKHVHVGLTFEDALSPFTSTYKASHEPHQLLDRRSDTVAAIVP